MPYQSKITVLITRDPRTAVAPRCLRRFDDVVQVSSLSHRGGLPTDWWPTKPAYMRLTHTFDHDLRQ